VHFEERSCNDFLALGLCLHEQVIGSYDFYVVPVVPVVPVLDVIAKLLSASIGLYSADALIPLFLL